MPDKPNAGDLTIAGEVRGDMLTTPPAPKSAAAILEDARTWLLGHGRYGEYARSDMGMFSLALGREPLSAERQRATDAVVAHVFNCESVWGLRWPDAWQRAIDAVREAKP